MDFTNANSDTLVKTLVPRGICDTKKTLLLGATT